MGNVQCYIINRICIICSIGIGNLLKLKMRLRRGCSYIFICYPHRSICPFLNMILAGNSVQSVKRFLVFRNSLNCLRYWQECISQRKYNKYKGSNHDRIQISIRHLSCRPVNHRYNGKPHDELTDQGSPSAPSPKSSIHSHYDLFILFIFAQEIICSSTNDPIANPHYGIRQLLV
ncbi:hypothetical protein D3C81_1743940 [compost metagenome]